MKPKTTLKKVTMDMNELITELELFLHANINHMNQAMIIFFREYITKLERLRDELPKK